MSETSTDCAAASPRTTLILETTHEAYVATDAEGRIIDWNPAATRTFGWTREEVIGRRLTDTIVPAADGDRHQRGLRRYAQTGEGRFLGRRLEMQAIDRDGRLLPVEVTISALHTEAGLSFHAFLHDITDRFVNRSNERLAAIVESASDAILATDEDGMITDWNRAAADLFGWRREEVIGRSVGVLVPEHLRGESDELWERARRGRPAVSYESERRHRDGSLRQVEVTVTRIDTADGRLACSAVYRDVTARCRQERELADHTARLKSLAATELGAAPCDDAAVEAGAPRAGLSANIVALVREQLGLDVAWAGEPAAPDHLALAGATPSLCVPVRHPDGPLYGALSARGAAPERRLEPGDVPVLQVIAGVLAEHAEQSERHAARSRVEAELTALKALLGALDARDHYTGAHSHAVVDLSRAVAARLGLSAEETEAVAQVALLHDLGKVGIPDSILQKPGKLTEAEWELMRQHPAIGARIVASITPLAHLAPACRAEHERWDGDGYPDGLAGTQIPTAARITLACDAYHAMVSDRPYRRSIGHNAALGELRRHRGTQFDPQVVDALVALLVAQRSPLVA